MIDYIVWDIAPEIFEGFRFLRWYGVSWIVGIIVGQWILFHIYKQEGNSRADVEQLTLYLILGAIVGARLGHVVFYDPLHYLRHPVEILPIKLDPHFQFTGLAGLASHGGVLGALLALYFHNKKFKKGYRWLLDRITIAAAALGGFIRLGNLMNSEIIGTPSSLPWAFVFTHVDQTPRHPAQLYEAFFYLAISTVLYRVWKSGKFNERHGFICGLGVALIFAQRFLMEFLKEKQVSFEDGLALNMGQMLSIPLVLGGIALMIWSLKKSQSSEHSI